MGFGFGPKVGQITPKWVKSGTFQIGKPKCTKILSEKVGFFFTYFGAKSDIPVCD